LDETIPYDLPLNNKEDKIKGDEYAKY